MSAIISQVVKSIGTSSVKAANANENRQLLQIFNKHASQTLRVKFGGAIVDDVTEVQKIEFATVPDAGSFKVTWNGIESAAVLSSEGAAELQTALRAISGLSSVTVSGDYTAGFTVTFTGAIYIDGDLPAMSVTSNTLTTSSVASAGTVTEITKGKYADGFTIAAASAWPASGPLQGDEVPLDEIYMKASGASTKVEILTG